MTIDMKTVKDVTLNGQTVKYIHDLNNNQLWPYNGPGPQPLNYFYFEGITDGTEIGIRTIFDVPGQITARFWISNDKTNWSEWGYNSFPVQTINSGEKLYIWNKENTMSNVRFTTSKNVKTGGNIMSLLNWREDLYDYCFRALFMGTKITTPPILPVTTLADSCYSQMFTGCTSLTIAPVLPATTLAKGCYAYMFVGCTNLTAAPVLPATTLAYGCYAGMFRGCTSLTTTPVLPATTLAERCYYNMFHNCTALSTTSELSANVLADSCCYEMFKGCTSLIIAPVLSANVLADSCYYGMFYDCTSLTTAPELPAIDLVLGCYKYMFMGCTNLNYVKAMFTTDISSTTNYTFAWLQDTSTTGTFVKNTNATWIRSDASGTNSWTVQTVNP